MLKKSLKTALAATGVALVAGAIVVSGTTQSHALSSYWDGDNSGDTSASSADQSGYSSGQDQSVYGQSDQSNQASYGQLAYSSGYGQSDQSGYAGQSFAPRGQSGSASGASGADAESHEADAAAFARSVSPVTLNVSFSDNPAGNGLPYQGYGRSQGPNNGSIELSNSVARDWNENLAQSHALIAHEIGHAASEYCAAQYAGPLFNRNDEAWATAYAWSRGYTGDGSGANLYGNPTQEQVAAAGNCR